MVGGTKNTITMALNLEDTEPADAPSTFYPLEPGKPGKLIIDSIIMFFKSVTDWVVTLSWLGPLLMRNRNELQFGRF